MAATAMLSTARAHARTMAASRTDMHEMIKYQMFPRTIAMTPELQEVLLVFQSLYKSINSDKHKFSSDRVLKKVSRRLLDLGYSVETGKTRAKMVVVPVSFGVNGKPEKSFHADALSVNGDIVIEVEAGRAYTNFQFLKDIFQAAMMIDVQYLVIAVRNSYRASDDFAKIHKFIDVMYTSQRIKLDLEGILLIGY
jgi:hypothetical protein